MSSVPQVLEGLQPGPRPSSAGDDGEAFGDAGHVVQHDAQQKKQHARHQDHRAHTRPRGPLHPAHRAGNPTLPIARLQPYGYVQGLPLGHGHHAHPFVRPTWKKATAQLPLQAGPPLLGGQGEHVAPTAGEADEDGGVLRHVRDSYHSDDVRIVRQLGDGQAGGQFGHAAAPGAADLLLAAAHLVQTNGAARVMAVQEFGPPPGAVEVEADLALQVRVLGQRLHVAKVHSLTGNGTGKTQLSVYVPQLHCDLRAEPSPTKEVEKTGL